MLAAYLGPSVVTDRLRVTGFGVMIKREMRVTPIYSLSWDKQAVCSVRMKCPVVLRSVEMYLWQIMKLTLVVINNLSMHQRKLCGSKAQLLCQN